MSLIKKWRAWQLRRYFDQKKLRGSRSNRKDILFLLEQNNPINTRVSPFMKKRDGLSHDILYFGNDVVQEARATVKLGAGLKLLKQDNITALFDIHYDYVISLCQENYLEHKIVLNHYPQSIKIGQFQKECLDIDLNIIANKPQTSLDLLAQIPNFIDQLNP